MFINKPKNEIVRPVARKGINSQLFLDIAEIKDGVIVLKNGGLRAILMVSSINFALKSIDEQDAIIFQYQRFLNSLDFSIQIVVNSRRLNIDNYLDTLKTKEKEQINELLRFQITEYREYVKGLVQMANIVSKSFYVVIPFAVAEKAKGGLLGKINSSLKKRNILNSREEFERGREQLWQRVEHIIGGLGGVGLKMTPINTQEIIELFYGLYNPGLSEKIGLADITELDVAQSKLDF